jgi:peptidyl-tRNA hydrolase
MSLGVIAAQLTHAAGFSACGVSLPEDTHAVVLQVPDEAALLAVHEDLLRADVRHSLIREPDAPFCGAATAIGVPPQLRDKLRPLLGKLALLR